MLKVDSVDWSCKFGSKAEYDAFVEHVTADKDAEIARLNALVSMQRNAIQRVVNDASTYDTHYPQYLDTALSATSETVSAYQNEVKAKALEDVAEMWEIIGYSMFKSPSDELRLLASKLRAKGE